MTPRAAAEKIDRLIEYAEEELSDIIIEYHDAELDAILARLDAIARAYEGMDKMSSAYLPLDGTSVGPLHYASTVA